jgi:hypothetical protein
VFRRGVVRDQGRAHEVGPQREHQAGLHDRGVLGVPAGEPAGVVEEEVQLARPERVPDAVDHHDPAALEEARLARQLDPLVEQARVLRVPVEQGDPLEAGPTQLPDDVADDADQRAGAQRRRAGEALAAARERLGAVAERLRRGDDDVDVAGHPQRELDRQQVIHADGQVRAVLLGRADGPQGHGARPGRGLDLRPAHLRHERRAHVNRSPGSPR